MNKNFHNLKVNIVLSDLKTSEKTGLTSQQAIALQEQHGFNEIEEQATVTWWKKLLEQFNNYLVWILIVGAIISVLAGELIDGILIIAIILFMAILGYIQDAKAEESLKNLKKLESHSTTVLRDGKFITIDTREVVVGDIVELKAGDGIPADIRIIEAQNCTIDESTLTGESLPCNKRGGVLEENTPLAERSNMAYSGTLLLEGKFSAVVVATGMETELGKIAKLLKDTKAEPTPLEHQLAKLGKFLSTVLIGMVTIVLFLNVFVRGEHFLEALIESVALAIAAVPEGLPAVITICLAFGTQVMVKKNALVRKLKAVEALGSVSVILTDKTGTLTTGSMSVTETWTTDLLASKKQQEKYASPLLGQLLRVAKLCNTNSNPTDIAILNWVKESAAEIPNLPKVFEYEFNSSFKRMSTVHNYDSNSKNKKETFFVATKGAPDILLNHTTHYFNAQSETVKLSPEAKKKVEEQLLEMTSKGLRVIALAERTLHSFKKTDKRNSIEDNLTLIGLIGLSDPAKKEVPEAIELARKAGIQPIMMTGDNPVTAKTIGLMVGLISKQEAKQKHIVMSGAELDEAIAENRKNDILGARIFARVSPSHKSYVVDLFQNAGYLVAMVGDGVNDAPSLKAAHVGVAMGKRGSDVTKSAADLVLLDDNYSTLVEAIKEGRFILQRIRLFVSYLLSCNFAEIGIFVAATIIGVPIPLTAVMLLLLNIVTDAAPAIAMSREPGDETLMNLSPRKRDESIITKPMWFNIGLMTVVTTFAVMVSYFVGLEISTATAQTMAFVTLSMTELFRAFTARSIDKSLFSIGLSKNKWIPGSVIFGTTVTLSIVYLGGDIFKTVHLSAELLVIAFAVSLVAPLVEEISKVTIIRKIL